MEKNSKNSRADEAFLNEENIDDTEKTEYEESDIKIDKKAKHRSPMNYIQVFFIHAFVIVVALWLMFGLFCGITSMPNTDMSPQFKSGDLLLFYRLGKDVKSQDVVVVKKNDTIYVGRVVAVPGDTVEITDDERLIINGNAVIEHNISGSTPRYEGFVEYPVTLGDREYFILGDARAGAEDSRYFGKVDSKEIMGVVITMIRRSNI